MAHLRAAIVSLVVLTVVTGIVYPLIVTGIAQVVFPYQANGSLIVKDGKAVGSALIGQPFDDPKYFWGRPSATSPFRLQCRRLVGIEPEPDESGARQGRAGARGRAAGRRPGQHARRCPWISSPHRPAGSTLTSAPRPPCTR